MDALLVDGRVQTAFVRGKSWGNEFSWGRVRSEAVQDDVWP